jgi:uncharacterized MAPEG superfamily protein
LEDEELDFWQEGRARRAKPDRREVHVFFIAVIIVIDVGVGSGSHQIVKIKSVKLVLMPWDLQN